MEKVAVSSLGKILSLKYPRDVLCCYATVCVSPKLRTQQLVSCRCQKKGSSASQEALETVQVGGSPRKSKTTESVRTQGWCCHEPLKKLTDGRLSLGWDLKMRKTGRGRSTRSTSCVSFSFAFASGLLLTLWKCHKDEHFTCGECGSGVTQRACRRVMLKSLSSYSIVIKSLSRKVTIILILCLFKKKKKAHRDSAMQQNRLGTQVRFLVLAWILCHGIMSPERFSDGSRSLDYDISLFALRKSIHSISDESLKKKRLVPNLYW